jgi:hypothetical protein
MKPRFVQPVRPKNFQANPVRNLKPHLLPLVLNPPYKVARVAFLRKLLGYFGAKPHSQGAFGQHFEMRLLNAPDIEFFRGNVDSPAANVHAQHGPVKQTPRFILTQGRDAFGRGFHIHTA